ncbi:TPA: hypothetical protein N5K71_003093 [Enterobacter hormaechei subsp. steigerwaltii]|uniref:hypothetical protein n=1 Tax=Enterobacter hormaechei TaxID=158836 RepID=UPI0013FDD84D|nr:hypothetical protein [Enterobacter hormaechei]MCM7454536.1 hypothetical protein [Enterobacter hormaechei]HCM9101084.1 hypothetical protein [Enterobacter hormaechei subsp. steigerwaltii]
MAWQGVPFVYEKTTGVITLVLEKLPPITINSSFPVETLITAIAGVVTAAITGWVAYKAIKENFALARYQTQLNTNRELSQQIRSAGAELVTDVIMLATTFEQWHLVGKKDVSLLSQGVFPVEIQAPLKAAEISKNKFLLLIQPDEEGCKLVALTAELQHTLKKCLSKGYFTAEEKTRFIDAQNAFIFGCHEYINKNLS